LKSLNILGYTFVALLTATFSQHAWAAEIKGSSEQQQALMAYDNVLPIEPLWSQRISVSFGKRYIKLQAMQIGDVVYSADWRGALYAVALESGELLWRHDVGDIVSGGVGGNEKLLLLGTNEGEIVALNPLDGKEIWRSQLSSEILSSPLVAEGRIVVHSNDGYVYGLSASDGKQQWAYQYKVPALTLRGTSSPIYSGGLVQVGLDNGKLVALDVKSGSARWEQTIAVPEGRSELQRMVDIDTAPLHIGNTLYVVSYQGRVAALDNMSGRVIWIRDFSSYNGMASDAQNLYVADESGDISAINLASGATLWKQQKLAGLGLTRPLISQGKLIVAARDGYLYWMDTESGELLSRTSVKALAARLRGLEWDLWDDYDRSGLPDFYDEDIGINAAPQQLDDGSLLVLDNQGHLTRFSHASEMKN